eukprot:325388_1
MLRSLHICKIICILMYLSIYCLNSDSLYGILASDSSLVEYTLSNGTKSIVDSPDQSLRSNVGLSCYDAVNYRYHYLYQDMLTIPIRIGIGSYDLYNNVSLDIIHLNEYFEVYRGLEDTFLLSCNPNNGDLHIFGTSKLNNKDMVLCSISFKNNIQYSKSLIYNVTKVKTYFDFNKLQNDSYINQPHVFDPNNNAIWFAHYFGNYITTNNWIWYNINPITGAILHQKDPVYFPNFTYLNYNTNNDKIIGGKIEIINDIGQMEVTLYNPIDLSVYRSYGSVPQFYPCGGAEISTIDIANNIWYIINNELSEIDGLKMCDKTVISALDISNTNNISYIHSSKMISRDDLMISMNNIKYYEIINVSITVENKIINLTNDKFVSYTIDMGQIVKNLVNISDPQLIYLASQLSPNILRIGGTLADYTYYQVGDENPCQLPTNQSTGYYCYTMEQFDNLINYAHKTNSSLIFGLSMGYPLFPKNDSSFWNSSNTKQFLEYLYSVKKYTNKDIYGFELGNEVNKDVEPSFQINAFKQLRIILQNTYGKNNLEMPILAGPDPHSYTLRADNSSFEWVENFIEGACDGVVDAFTYHCYINVNSTYLLTQNGINEQYKESNRFQQAVETYCPNHIQPVYAGEIAEHNNGGVDGFTNKYEDSLWYLNALGITSLMGQKGFFRQQLWGYDYHPNYALLNNIGNSNNEMYVPLSDYWIAVLFKQLMGTNVFNATSSYDSFRVYSHCHKGNPSVVMAYINFDNQPLNVSFGKNLGTNHMDYIITSDKNQLDSSNIYLNGYKLILNNDHTIPVLNGNTSTKNPFEIPPYSVGFIHFSDVRNQLCRH